METINDRIAYLIKELDMTKTKFAERLHVTPSFVTILCNGKCAPSDRTISDICREFNVSEEWLRDGIGEMFLRRTRNQQIGIWITEVMGADDSDFRKNFVSSLAALSLEDWQYLEKIAKKMTEGR